MDSRFFMMLKVAVGMQRIGAVAYSHHRTDRERPSRGPAATRNGAALVRPQRFAGGPVRSRCLLGAKTEHDGPAGL